MASPFEGLLMAQNSILLPNGPTWLTYTPVWSSTGTAPVIGNGTITGRYYKTGHLVVFSVYLSGGSTTTGGTGNYSVSLPVTPLTTGNLVVGSYSGLFDHVGTSPGAFSGSILAGATAMGGVGNISGFNYMGCINGTSGLVQWNATNPFTISGANFSVQISGHYESNA